MVPALVMNNGDAGDRISDLHDSILLHIVSMLPTKYGVRSSILSTRWKLLWTFVTKLDFFDDNEGRYRDADVLKWFPPGRFGDPDEGRDKFTQFVNRVLLIRLNNPTPVHMFLLKCNLLKCDQSQLNSWICQSIQLSVKELVVSIKYSSDAISLPPPSRWIHCKTLVVLDLIGDMCFDIPEFSSICFPSLDTLKFSRITYAVARNASVQFPKLKMLDLTNVLYKSEDSLYKLLQSCPVLEHLCIVRSRWDNIPNLVISKPTLISLFIEIGNFFMVPPGVGVGECWSAKLDAPQLECLTFVDLSWIKPCFSVETSAFNSLTKATFDLLFMKGKDIDTNYRNAVFKLIDRLPSNLEHLLFIHGAMRVLLCSSPEYKLYNFTVPSMFRNLTTLDLHVYICFNWRAVMIMIKNLLQLMDNLQIILLAHNEFCEEHDDIDQPLFEPKGLISPRLRQVEVANIEGCTHEFELLRYILLNAKHLELMTLVVNPWQLKRFQLLHTILSTFPRGSPTCQIQFKPFV